MMIETVLVTGGGSGIGAALATELAGRKRNVVISGRRQSALDDVAGSSDRITTCSGDITNPAHRSALADALANLPGPRAVFHGAGYFQTGLLDQLSASDWRRSFETNVEARWELSRQCAELVDGGRILFIGSDAGANPRSGAAAYSIAQSASETLRRALQAEWVDKPVDVGAFKPGLVDTTMVRNFMALPSDVFPGRSAYDGYLSRGQIASPSSVARFASWLLLDVPAEQFAELDWDIRDAEHHGSWCDGPLYPHMT